MKNLARIEPVNVDDMDNVVMPNGRLVAMPHAYYEQHDLNKKLYFMWLRGLYILPTWELIEWLRQHIIGSAIEVCAGNGSIGRALGIPATDSKMQERPEIRMWYQLMNQPVITYPSDVEALEAAEAVKKYNPDTVVGSYITHRYDAASNSGNAEGPDEAAMLSSVRRYIMIGNLDTHGSKPLLTRKHEEHRMPWLICRANDQTKNRIFVWDNFGKQ